ncbi:alpha/beta hydrolase fold domain-containing protein [Nocardiopsis alba]|uniref:alpha/beta hydrolase n=1 Tax=Nocardiopsis alba TaxID=53437 RepID=UPI0033B251B6
MDDRQWTRSARDFTYAPWTDRDSAYIVSAESGPVRDEGIEYASRLLRAGVSVELHQWAGAFHGSQALLSASVSRRRFDELCAVVERALSD